MIVVLLFPYKENLKMEAKKWYLSKTLWAQVVGLVAIIVPQTHDFIAANLGEAGAAWLFVNAVLRMLTKQELT